MPDYQEIQGSFQSADGVHTVRYTVYTPNFPPIAVLQVCHGMAEHRGRYRDLGVFLAENGVAMCIHDHLGHGETAKDAAEYGWFGKLGSRKWLIADAKRMTLRMRSQFPHLPYYIMGHSMGSFVVRAYLAAHPDLADGAILMGTGHGDFKIRMGKYVAGLLALLRGTRYRSRWLQSLSFGGYLSRIPDASTDFDWLSTDPAKVQAYIADPACGFLFSAGGFAEVAGLLSGVSHHRWAGRIRKDAPILLLSGAEDPVGNYGDGAEKTAELLKTAGVQDVLFKLYPNVRHEPLNDTESETVKQDILNWVLYHAQGKAEEGEE